MIHSLVHLHFCFTDCVKRFDNVTSVLTNAYIQFYHFMHHVTDLKKKEIMMTFDLLDWNDSGEIGFQQFYMLVCMSVQSLPAPRGEVHLLRYSRPVFELLDMDGGRTISPAEFQASGFLFNLKGHALDKIFFEFNVSGDEVRPYPTCPGRRAATDRLYRHAGRAQEEARI
ncbi:EF-hand calcium-binding domain-containing protein 9 [Salvelinus sp. IW2-2015]|uniref:EF-hand calcium-binding domain-containing protein 9 n=1 Tax=Salvelinus sp. IW2-2015 TaxID=2691554 RepID=UPI0038D4B840